MSRNNGNNNSGPEWLGGAISSIATAPYAASDSKHGSSTSSKKKHRRSKSDTSYQNSSSRNAAERKDKRKKEHRRNKSGSRDVDALSNSNHNQDLSAQSLHSSNGKVSITKKLEQPKAKSSTTASKSKDGRKESSKRHRRSHTAPAISLEAISVPGPASTSAVEAMLTPKKKSSTFLSWFGFGRSEANLKNDNNDKYGNPNEREINTSVHLHLHKIDENFDDEKFDIEESRPLGWTPTPTSSSSLNRQLPYPSTHTSSSSEQFNSTSTGHSLSVSGHSNNEYLNSHFQDERNAATKKDNGHLDESDDLLSYSDDESFIQHQSAFMGPKLYPTSYLSDEDLQNHEYFQVMKQQRMMNLTSTTNFKASQSYGSINDNIGNVAALPPLTQQHLPLPQQRKKNQQHQQAMNMNMIPNVYQPKVSKFYRTVLSSSNSNDMYLSEDDTLTSFHTQETYRNVDNFYFERTAPDEHRTLLPPQKVVSKSDYSDNSEDDERKILALLSHQDKLEENIQNSPTDDMDKTQHRRNSILGPKQYDSLDLAQHTGDNSHSSGSSSSKLITPPSQTFSYNTNHEVKTSLKSQLQSPGLQLQRKRSKSDTPPDSPPPPVVSVQILRNSNEIGTASFSSSSPQMTTPLIKKSPSSSSQHMQMPRMTRKEIRRFRKRIEIAEKREEYVQILLQDINRDRGFDSFENNRDVQGSTYIFPREKKKSRDTPFAIPFFMQIGIIIFIATKYAGGTMLQIDSSIDTDTDTKTTTGAYSSYSEEDPYMVGGDDPFSSGSPFPTDASPISIWTKDIYVDYTNALQLLCITGLYATVLSALAIGMMMILSTTFIPTVLCVTVVMCIVSCTMMIALSHYTVLPLLALTALAISLAYSIVVWDRIPFATTNLHTALVGIKSNPDVLLVGFIMMLVSFMGTITWAIAFLGIYDNYLDNSYHELSNNITWEGLSMCVGMLASYIWAFHVILVRLLYCLSSNIVANDSFSPFDELD